MNIYINIRFYYNHRCLKREEIKVETKTIEDSLKQLSALTAEDFALKIKQLRDSQLRILLMLHQRKILNNKELSILMLSQSFTSKCNIVSLVLFTPELLKLDLLLIEKLELHHKEFKEMLLAELFKRNKNDCILKLYQLYYLYYQITKYNIEQKISMDFKKNLSVNFSLVFLIIFC